MANIQNPKVPLSLLLLICLSFIGTAFALTYDLSNFSRRSFPKGFLFGAASSAYQYEGAASEGGRGPSIWDTFAHKYPEKIADGSNGDVALDFYHRYKDDIKLMKYIGLDVFRMSISWSRILPRGNLIGGVNKKGIAFYNNVFNELIANGITPFVTLFHWDVPQELEDSYRGFLSPLIMDDFKAFANVCFAEFGDRVKNWITINEPFSFVNGGYDGGVIGTFAPYRCSPWANCPRGNSETEPYVVGHHVLLCHAETVKLYREKYQATQKGQIGITLVTHWIVPYSKNTTDVRAARRAFDFMFGWFAHPVVYGEYPKAMQILVGDRLPTFSDTEIAMLNGSYDFLGMNYYTGNYAQHIPNSNAINASSTTDSGARLSTSANGVPIGDPTGVGAFYVYPQGLYNLLVYTKDYYKNPKIYITENGIGDVNIAKLAEEIKDPQRIDFYNRHFRAVESAIAKGVNVKGFFGWSYMDNFEWGSGYTLRFGLCYVDYKNNLTRTLKSSAFWFKNSLKKT